MNNLDTQYILLLEEILEKGVVRNDRTSVGRKSLFGKELHIDLTDGFPLLTSKRVPFDLIKTELLWFLGCHMQERPYFNLQLTNIKYLVDNDNNIWVDWPYEEYKKWVAESLSYHKNNETVTQSIKEEYMADRYNTGEFDFLTRKEFINRIKRDLPFADAFGNLGPVYGKQWLNFEGKNETPINQIDRVINNINNDPFSSRHVISAWNPAEQKDMLLPPCHYSFQFYVEPNLFDPSLRFLSCKFNMRSTDVFLGLPFNIASYALLTHLVAEQTNAIPYKLIFSGGDVHLYMNHLEQAKKQIENFNKKCYGLPILEINEKVNSIFKYKKEHIKLLSYQSHETIKAPIAV